MPSPLLELSASWLEASATLEVTFNKTKSDYEHGILTGPAAISALVTALSSATAAVRQPSEEDVLPFRAGLDAVQPFYQSIRSLLSEAVFFDYLDAVGDIDNMVPFSDEHKEIDAYACAIAVLKGYFSNNPEMERQVMHVLPMLQLDCWRRVLRFEELLDVSPKAVFDGQLLDDMKDAVGEQLGNISAQDNPLVELLQEQPNSLDVSNYCKALRNYIGQIVEAGDWINRTEEQLGLVLPENELNSQANALIAIDTALKCLFDPNSA